jgi:transposase
MDWEDRLDEWETELALAAQLEGSDWVTLEKAAAETGVSRAALRSWYRTDQIPSRLVDGPHGPQRLVPLAVVAERAEASPRLRRTAERRLSDEAQLELLRHRVDQLELRLAALERRQLSKNTPLSLSGNTVVALLRPLSLSRGSPSLSGGITVDFPGRHYRSPKQRYRAPRLSIALQAEPTLTGALVSQENL